MVYDAKRTPMMPEHFERQLKRRQLRTALIELIGWAEDDLELPLIDISHLLQQGAANVLTALLKADREAEREQV